MTSSKKSGVTIVELTVVILILSILATVAAQVYVSYVARARFARCRFDIRQLELAATSYMTDVGAYPLSSSGAPSAFGNSPPELLRSVGGGPNGCGYLMLCLLHSYSGHAQYPASPRWGGPYMTVDMSQLGDLNAAPVTQATPITQHNLLDPWGRPYYYLRNDDYRRLGGTEQAGTQFYEVYFNPSTVQIFSKGPDGFTSDPPESGLGKDDMNNFDNRAR